MMKSAPTWIPNSKGNQLLLGYRIPKEIVSYLDTEFQRKSAPTWIPISKGKSAPIWIPESRREIGSNMDTGIPQVKKSAPNWIPESCKKSAPNWIPESRKKSAPNWIPESHKKSAPNWIPESCKKSAPNWIPESRKKSAPNWIPESRKKSAPNWIPESCSRFGLFRPVIWIDQQISRDLTLSGPIIQEKAKKFAILFNIDNFLASGGWLSNFKRRNNLHTFKIRGEAGSAPAYDLYDEDQNPPPIDILDSINLIAEAWKMVTKKTIINNWDKAGILFDDESNTSDDDDSEIEDDSEDLQLLINRLPITDPLNIEEYINIDNEIITEEELTSEEIVNIVRGQSAVEEHVEEEDETVAASGALNSIEKLIRYVQQNDLGIDNSDMQNLLKLKKKIISDIPGCSKGQAHRTLGFELKVLLQHLRDGSCGYSKAAALEKSLQQLLQSRIELINTRSRFLLVTFTTPAVKSSFADFQDDYNEEGEKLTKELQDKKVEEIESDESLDEFTFQDRELFTQRFQSMKSYKKWKLSTGTYVEDVLYNLGKKCRYHNLVHSFIIDLGDKFVQSGFTSDEINEICETKSITTVSDWVRLLEMEPNPLTSTQDLPENLYLKGEKAGLATKDRKNRGRTLSNIGPMQRKSIGKKGDGYVRSFGSRSIDWAASEAGSKWEGEQGTKTIKECSLSLPKVLKDIFISLARKVDFDEDKMRKINIPGFIHAGANLIKTNLDCPKGYVCRYMREAPLEIYADVKQFSRTLDALVSIIYAKLEILNTMEIVNFIQQTHLII
ncbi:unnamed protein product [Rhizophagus irregularis]|nr:unnamed protein product [Rhizophagus irregularis]